MIARHHDDMAAERHDPAEEAVIQLLRTVAWGAGIEHVSGDDQYVNVPVADRIRQPVEEGGKGFVAPAPVEGAPRYASRTYAVFVRMLFSYRRLRSPASVRGRFLQIACEHGAGKPPLLGRRGGNLGSGDVASLFLLCRMPLLILLPAQ